MADPGNIFQISYHTSILDKCYWIAPFSYVCDCQKFQRSTGCQTLQLFSITQSGPQGGEPELHPKNILVNLLLRLVPFIRGFKIFVGVITALIEAENSGRSFEVTIPAIIYTIYDLAKCDRRLKSSWEWYCCRNPEQAST